MLKPIRRKKKVNHNQFSIDAGYKGMIDDFEVGAPRRLRGFIESKQDGRDTWTVDFQLSQGLYYGWTLWDMSGDVNAIGALHWMLEKDFPDEIKQTIMKHFEDRGLSEESKKDGNMIDSDDAITDYIDVDFKEIEFLKG